MIEDDMRQSKINSLKIRIKTLENDCKDLSNEKPIDASNVLNNIRHEVTQSRFGEAKKLSDKLQTALQQRSERYLDAVQKIENCIATDLSYFETTS